MVHKNAEDHISHSRIGIRSGQEKFRWKICEKYNLTWFLSFPPTGYSKICIKTRYRNHTILTKYRYLVLLYTIMRININIILEITHYGIFWCYPSMYEAFLLVLESNQTEMTGLNLNCRMAVNSCNKEGRNKWESIK